VANRTGGSISLFDLATGVEMARVPIGPAIPHEVAVGPDGRLALTGEYGPNDAPDRCHRAGTRLVKFSADGTFLFDWGQVLYNPDNPGPNEFWSVHNIGLSRDRRLFVADREHKRMQVFDEHGKFLEMWPTGYNSRV
jgi:hypothetical protein